MPPRAARPAGIRRGLSSVAVVGTTAWGTTLALLLAQKGMPVRLWARTAAEAHDLNVAGEHRRRVPGIPFPAQLKVTADLDEALGGAELVLFAVPSQQMRANARMASPHLPRTALVLSAAKGLEVGSCRRMTEVLAEELGDDGDRVCVLSGPNIQREIAQGMPAATVVAAPRLEVADRVRDLMVTPRFRVYSSNDVVGVELGGTLKNIVAMGAGLNDGWGYGANTKAAYMTRGLAEMTRLGVAEGPSTTIAARELGQRLGVEMPITEVSYQVLYQGLDPRTAITALMLREPKHEWEGLGDEP